MVTRRVSGPFTIRCPHCGATYGPFSQITMGAWQCSRCKRSFNVR